MGSDLRVHYGEEIDNDYTTFQEASISYASIALSLVTSICTLIFAVYHVFITKKINIYLKWHTYSLLVALIFNVMYCIRVFVEEHINIMTDAYIACADYAYLSSAAIVAIARFSLYQFYLARLNTILEGTVFNFAAKTYKTLNIAMSMTVTLSLINYEILVAISNCGGIFYVLAVFPAVVQDLFWSVFICWAFITRMKAVAALVNKQNHKQLEFSKSQSRFSDCTRTDVQLPEDSSLSNISEENSNKPADSVDESSISFEFQKSSEKQNSAKFKSPSAATITRVDVDRNHNIMKVCHKMVVVTSVTCTTTIFTTGTTGWLIGIAVTSTADIAINGVSVLFPFKFMQKQFDRLCFCCSRVCQNIELNHVYKHYSYNLDLQIAKE